MIHGRIVPDPYRWLEDPDSPETVAWVQAQNAVTSRYLEGIPQREAIRDRLTRLWDHERYGVPFREGGRTFWFRNDGLQNQAVLWVQDDPDAEPRVLLDPNLLSADGAVALTSVAVTRDGTFLGYGIASGGSDWQEYRVRVVDTGEDLPDRVEWVKFSGISWTGDGGGFIYARYPQPPADRMLEANRDMMLCYHRLGTSQDDDLLLYRNPERPEWGFQATVTEDGRFVTLSVWHGTAPENRLFYMELGDPERPDLLAPVVELIPEPDAAFLPVDIVDRTLFMVTDLAAPRRRLVAVELDRPGRSSWRTVVAEGEEVLEGAWHVGGRFLLQYLQDAQSRLRVHGRDGAPLGEVELPGPGSLAGLSGRRDSPDLFFGFTSFLHPTTIFRHDLETGISRVFRAPRVGFDAGAYLTEQLFYRSRDGTRIPIFVTRRRDLPLDGSNPVLMHGYGGFNVSLTPVFSVVNLVWLELGGIYAVPNLRGGGEYGEDWHRAGMLERKQNVFDDFIAAAEFLVERGYTRPDRIAISGGSNGGLLVGAVVNQRPELFGVALPSVGVMDMLRFHLFTIGWAWVSDYGSAEDPAMFPHLLAYSPLHNIRKGACHPATLITTADHDDRVVPGHSFKYAAALQEAQGCGRPILIRVETRAGHGAGKPTEKQIEEAADRLAFTVRNLGMAATPPDEPDTS